MDAPYWGGVPRHRPLGERLFAAFSILCGRGLRRLKKRRLRLHAPISIRAPEVVGVAVARWLTEGSSGAALRRGFCTLGRT